MTANDIPLLAVALFLLLGVPLIRHAFDLRKWRAHTAIATCPTCGVAFEYGDGYSGFDEKRYCSKEHAPTFSRAASPCDYAT